MNNDQGTKLIAKNAAQTLRAILYARVSTDEQAEKGYSLPSQLDACKKYAEAHGFTVVAEFVDDITGVTPFIERPNGKQAQALLDRKEADIIIVYQVDRLSRDIVGLLQTVRNWLKAGIEVYCCDVGKIKSELDIILVIKGWAAGDERERIRERTTRGRNTKAQNGKVPACGKPPYGYAFSDELDQLVIVEEEAKFVRMIFEWYTLGEDNSSPLSARTIAHKLSRMRVPTPAETGHGGMKRKRAPGIWGDASINNILANETYAGIFRWGTRNREYSKKRKTWSEIPIPVPAIISHEVWEVAQARREYNKKMSRRNAKGDYLLRGRVTCECGYSMCASMSGSKDGHHNYRCTSHVHKYRDLGEHSPCTEPSPHGNNLDAIVWDFIVGIMSDEKKFKQALLDAQNAELEAVQPKRDLLATTEELITKCKSNAEKLVRALANAPGGIVGDTLQQQVDEVNKLYEDLIHQRGALLAELDTQVLTERQIANALAFRETVIEGMKNPTFQDKLQTLEDLDVRVHIHNEQARITCRIPKVEGVIDLKSTDLFAFPSSRSPIPQPARQRQSMRQS